MNKFCCFLLLANLFFLSGCQTSEVLEEEYISIPTRISTYGAGDVKIGIILPALSNNISLQNMKDYLDGTKFATDTLGNNQIQLIIHETDGSKKSSMNAAVAIQNAGSKMILGTTISDNAVSVAKAVSIPLIAYIPNHKDLSSGGFAFLDDSISGINSAFRATISEERNSVLVFSPRNYSKRKLTRVTDYIAEAGGKLIQNIEYSDSLAKLSKEVQSNGFIISTTHISIFLGNPDQIIALVREIEKNASNPSIKIAEASAGSIEKFARVDEMSATVFGTSVEPNIEAISTQFQEKYKRDPTKNVAVAFDSVAVAAGMMRSGKLDDGIAENLTKNNGFSALTGIFRFKRDGRIERKHEIRQIRKGKAVLVQEQGSGF